MTRIRNLCVLLVAASFMIGCSSRQIYQTSANAVPPSPNAININTATSAELEKLPHIGKTIAATIVEFRATNGPFRRPEHLMLVSGVSDKRFRDIRDLIKTE